MTERGGADPVPLLATAEVAQRFGVSRSTVCRWTRQDRITLTRTQGVHARYRAQDIDRLLADRGEN